MRNFTKMILAACMIMGFALGLNAQSVGINGDGLAPDNSAMLDVKSTTKGFLFPRITFAHRNSISTPVAGLTIWCSNCATFGELQVYNGTTWTNIIGGTASGEGVEPGAPAIVTATAGVGEALITFTAPSSNGWSPILSYTATSSPGGITGTLNQAGSGRIIVTGLTNGTAYTFTITATNAFGTSAASAASNSVTPVSTFAVGLSYGGGIIFYLDGTGVHGLVAALSDQSTSADWGCWEDFIGSSGSAIGTGQANTTAIVTGCPYDGIAARVCYELILNGYSDWFLPSKDELNQMYLQKAAIGGFKDSVYWSSTDIDATLAYIQIFENGGVELVEKVFSGYVRAVRAF